LLVGVVGAVLLSGIWNPEQEFQILSVQVRLQDLVRDLSMLVLAGLSLLLTSSTTRALNGFSWDPIVEVAKLFFGIFVSMIPAIAILKAGSNGALQSIIALVTHDGAPVNHMYFWLTGGLSSFLDNAPTYLVFFNTAGGDAAQLMAEAPKTLAAISCGAVFMGANSYIGNAPNFMVRSIAESQGVQMPSFLGYMAWSLCILIPLFILTTFLFFLS
ncbi:MAG: sodium:proton antiporter, partial [Humidesulfovibrio sp.]|nr:sodium:proton antiporter [Humidesulfovibrio sp.]